MPPRDNEEDESEELPEVEMTESGTPILRHYERERAGFEIGHRSPFAEAIEAHVERHIGPIETVLHEIISELVHVDILLVAPSDERPFHTLVTCGMSAKPMAVPPEVASQLDFDARYCELMICLPPDWPMGEEAWKDEANYWPVRWLKILARLPHEYGTWLWFGHTVPNGDPPAPFAPNTGLCCTMLAPPLTIEDQARSLQVEDEGREATVWFWAMQTLHADEIAFKLKNGGDAIFEALAEANVGDILDVARPSAVPAKRPWWKRR
jgi:hypothetical protein